MSPSQEMSASTGRDRLLVGVLLFSLVLLSGSAQAGGILAVVAAGSLLSRPFDVRTQQVGFALGLAVLATVLSLLSLRRDVLPLALSAGTLAGWGALAGLLHAARDTTTRWRAAVVVGALAAGSIALLLRLDAQVLDVWIFHDTAGRALFDGRTPWTGLGMPHGSPFVPEGTVVDGYPYPPLVLVLYGASAVLHDPRWVGILGWVAGLAALTALPGRRPRWLIVLLAAVPGWIFAVLVGWTEPLSFALLAGALVLWRRSPAVSAVLLGLAIGSKQYLVLAGVLLLASKVDGWTRRVLIAGGVAVASYAVAFVLGEGAFASLVGFHLDQPPRPDSANLYALVALVAGDIGWPGWLAPLAGTVTAVALGRNVRDASDFAWALATTLSVFFLLASQAFANYWLLVLGLVVTAMLLRASGGAPAASSSTNHLTASSGARRA